MARECEPKLSKLQLMITHCKCDEKEKIFAEISNESVNNLAYKVE